MLNNMIMNKDNFTTAPNTPLNPNEVDAHAKKFFESYPTEMLEDEEGLNLLDELLSILDKATSAEEATENED